jgi:hypothetical protein
MVNRIPRVAPEGGEFRPVRQEETARWRVELTVTGYARASDRMTVDCEDPMKPHCLTYQVPMKALLKSTKQFGALVLMTA